VTPAVNIISGVISPPIPYIKLLLSEHFWGGARVKASRKMNALGTKMNRKVLNLFLRIFLSHNDSVVIMIRLDHLYTLALAADWIEGALRPSVRTAVVEVTDSSMPD